jgi:hypothetical protein
MFFIKTSSSFVNGFQAINQAYAGLKTILNKQRHFQASFLLFFVGFTRRKSKRQIDRTPSDRTSQNRNEADGAPPTLEIDARQDNDDPQNDPEQSIGLTHITFHNPYSLLSMVL